MNKIIIFFVFLDFPVTIAYMLGFVLSGVSPAVIIPSLIPLIESGYGTEKGIHTLVITACSADDVVAIRNVSVVASTIFF